MSLLRTLVASTLLISSSTWAADIKISDPYARAVPPGQSTSAIYMQMENTGSQSVDLTSAESSAAGAVELHTHINDSGVMKMRQIDKIKLPTGKAVALQPGGLHLMLFDLTRSLNAGDAIDLTLYYSDGSEQQISVPVRSVMPMPMKHKGKQN